MAADHLNLFAIQRFCYGDGPGIRTTVFLQGCHLHCPWCHNPEARPGGHQVAWQSQACCACGRCLNPLPTPSCRRQPQQLCRGCGQCADECPAAALTVQGRPTPLADILAVVNRDRFYYDQTGGGMTLSGGEPLLQKNSLELLRQARHQGLHTAIETSGAVPAPDFAPFIGAADLFLYDLKTTPERYPKLIGCPAQTVLDNLRALSAAGAAIILRVPLVAGVNATPDFLDFLRHHRHLPGVIRIDLLPYHDLGRGKASQLGLPEADWSSMAPPDPDLLQHWQDCLRE